MKPIGLLTDSPLAAESGFVPRDLKPPFGTHFRFSGDKVSLPATFFPNLAGLRGDKEFILLHRPSPRMSLSSVFISILAREKAGRVICKCHETRAQRLQSLPGLSKNRIPLNLRLGKAPPDRLPPKNTKQTAE